MIVSLYLLFEVLAIVFCLHYLYGEKIKIDVAAVGVVLYDILLMRTIGILGLNHNLTWLIFPAIIIYCCIRFGINLKAIFINNILWMLIISILQIIIILIMGIILNISYIGDIETLIVNVFVFGFVALFVRTWHLEKLSHILQTNGIMVIISILMIMFGISSCLSQYRNRGGFNIAYYIFFFVGLIIFFAISFDIVKSKIKAKEIEKELKLHKIYEDSFQNLIDDIRARQHEFDNHINVIYSQHYLSRSFEELVDVQKKYCKSIVLENKYNKLLSKGNAMIIGFLYSKFSEAHKLGIDVEYKVQIGDMSSNVPIYKVVELLGNLINNAVEALQGQEELNKMKVVVLERASEIVINVSNQCKNIRYEEIQKFFKKGYSEKGKGRGYGLYNVKKICEEYGMLIESAINNRDNIEWISYMIIINKPL